MKKLSVLLPMALFVVVISTAFSQSLADLANKEKERRAGIKDEKVITEEEAAKFRSSSETTSSAPENATAKTDSGEAGKGAAAKSPKDGSEEPTDLQGRPESYWRQSVTDARQKVKDLETEENVLLLKRNQLQNDFYSADSGFQQEEYQRQIQKTIYEQDQNKEKLEKARTELQDLLKEARSSGALPGWIEAH